MTWRFKGIIVWGNRLPKKLITDLNEVEQYSNFTIMFENETKETKEITVRIPKEFQEYKKEIISSIILQVDKSLTEVFSEKEGNEKVEEEVWS